MGYISPVFKAELLYVSCLGKFFTLIGRGGGGGYRTSDHVFVLKSLIDLYGKNDKKVYDCLVEFQKAYDTIWRNGLFYKLMKF